MKRLITCLLLISTISLACPDDQHDECLVPRPWPFRGCAQSICVPNIKNPIDSLIEAVNNKALALAIDGRDSEQIKNREDCIILVTAGLTVWGASIGGTVGAITGGAAGVAASSLACRKAFPLY